MQSEPAEQRTSERRPRYQSNGIQSVKTKTDAQQRRKFVTALVDGHSVRLQVDTGSDITFASKASWKRLGSHSLQPVTEKGKRTDDASNNPIRFSEQTTRTLKVNGRTAAGRIFVGYGPFLTHENAIRRFATSR
uniref:Peptidase A2 domain-containing protein n=1 Tax=Ascaris lumbricoides TaxID=6252 RepID=A0A0M3IBQ0_ASCLU